MIRALIIVIAALIVGSADYSIQMEQEQWERAGKPDEAPGTGLRGRTLSRSRLIRAHCQATGRTPSASGGCK